MSFINNVMLADGSAYDIHDQRINDIDTEELGEEENNVPSSKVVKEYIDNNYVDTINSQDVGGDKTFSGVIHVGQADLDTLASRNIFYSTEEPGEADLGEIGDLWIVY